MPLAVWSHDWHVVEVHDHTINSGETRLYSTDRSVPSACFIEQKRIVVVREVELTEHFVPTELGHDVFHELFKCIKRPEPSGPMDLSSAAPVPKRARSNTVSMSMSSSSIGTPPSVPKTPESPSLQEDISGWSVEDVANFLTGIDICAEYAP
ncbi:hypothetical protein YQE_06864, partial [Dendroctonus ponderosae]